MKPKQILFCTLLIPTISFGGDLWGHFEVNRYFNSNVPAYTDNSGPSLLYGLDLELNKPLLGRYLSAMVGADSQGASSGFTKAAGRAGATFSVGAYDLYLFHRSAHNFDHAAATGPRFITDNHVGVRLNFGQRPNE